MHIIAAKAVALGIAQSEPFKERQRQTIANARALGEGLTAGGVDVLTGGTDVHLVLVDLTPTGVFGKEAELRLEEVGITVNRNAIPFDERKPMDPSGLRIGTPALTTRGLVEDDMREIAEVIVAALGDDFESNKGRPARPLAGADGALPALPAALRRRGLSAESADEDLGRHERAGARARAAADHRAPAGAGPRGHGHLARVHADPRAARAARHRAHADRQARRCLAARKLARLLSAHGRDAPLRQGHAASTSRSRTAPTTSRSRPGMLGVPEANMHDYEFAVTQHQVGCRLAKRVIFPDSVPPERLRRFGVTPEKLFQYPGIKEEYYLADFEPDPGILERAGGRHRRGSSSSCGRRRTSRSITASRTRSFPRCSLASATRRTCMPWCCRGPTRSGSSSRRSACPR